MNLRYSLTRRARLDIRAICKWYDSQGEDLADGFLTELRATLRAISERPESFPRAGKGLRVTRCGRFPYKIYLRSTPTAVEILAVYHTARRPGRWKDQERE